MQEPNSEAEIMRALRDNQRAPMTGKVVAREKELHRRLAELRGYPVRFTWLSPRTHAR